jgi:hypothetical protein
MKHRELVMLALLALVIGALVAIFLRRHGF